MGVGYLQQEYWAEGYWPEEYWIDYGPGGPALDVANYKTESWTVSKSMEDKFWVLRARIEKHETPEFFQLLQATVRDHQNITRTPFVGIIPAINYQLKTAEDKAEITGYDYAWYLTVQHVPDSMLNVDIDQNPSETIMELLGGNDWEKTTGIEPYRINNVTDWETIKTEFTFKDKTIRWSAIAEIADHCNFVFIVKWREIKAGTWKPCAYFVHEDDIDTENVGIDTPAAVTITAPDTHLINDVMVKDEPIFRYNKILCVGYSQEDNEYFYSTAQTYAVAVGDEIAREYTYTDPKLDTKDKTEAKAQELLEFFQDSAITYIAKFKSRMDLELYQKITFVGYRKIPEVEMRITKISYSRETANDTVEIEFSKNQAISQMQRLARIMKTRIHYETFIDDMWEVSGGYAQLIESRPINMRGWKVYNSGGLDGPRDSDVAFRGWRQGDARFVEYLRWDQGVTEKALTEYIRVLEDIVIDNDVLGGFPKIYFGIEQGKETYIQAINTSDLYGLDLTAGGAARGAMLSLINPTNEEEEPYILLQRHTLTTTDLTVGGTIKAWPYGEEIIDLTFYDRRAGTKTLSDLAGAGAGLWVEARIEGEDFAQLKLDRAINMQSNHLRRVSDPIYTQDAATRGWCLRNFLQQGEGEGGGMENPAISNLDMNGYDILDCDNIECYDIDCDDIKADNIWCDDIECEILDCTNHGIYNISHLDFWARGEDDPPDKKTQGTMWYDGNNAVFKYWTGSRWKTITAT
jgi:hypothetical protein